MAHRSPSASDIDKLIFWSGEIPEKASIDSNEVRDAEEHVGDCAEMPEKGKGKAPDKGPAMYVTLCEDMIKTVLAHESFLFSQEELAVFEAYRCLSYGAKFLLIRLLLRKADKWHRLSKLKYEAELGRQGILDAIAELCTPLSALARAKCENAFMSSEYDAGVKVESTCSVRGETEIIDLTLDGDEDEDEVKSEHLYYCPLPPGTSHAPGPVPDHPLEQRWEQLPLEFFAVGASLANIEDLIGCLHTDELKSIAKTMKLPKINLNRSALTSAIFAAASSQSTLHSFVVPVARKLNASMHLSKRLSKQAQLPLASTSKQSQIEILRSLVMNELKKVIRITSSIRAVFKRLHIVFFRSMAHPTTLMTDALLARFRKRSYSAYLYERTSNIFPTRESLLAYETALELEAEVSSLLDGYPATAKAPISPLTNRRGTPAKAEDKENTDTQGVACGYSVRHNPSSTVCCDVAVAPTHAGHVDVEAVEEATETHRIQATRRVVPIFERVYPRWQELVALKGGREGRECGLERFDEGWVLTRIVAKGAEALGALRQFEREVQVLEALLSQRRWRRGKRGNWYDRLALVFMAHLTKSADGERLPGDKAREFLEKAMHVVTEGLKDPDTHIVCRPSLESRLTRLEKQLRVPLDERHQCSGVLGKPDQVVVEGVRVRNRSASVALDRPGWLLNQAIVPGTLMGHVQVLSSVRSESAASDHVSVSGTSSAPPDAFQKQSILDVKTERWKGKSIWVGRQGEEISVEMLALQHYEALGYKGFHSEGQIVRMIFGLLFWDIIFAPIPGAFETAFQSAPLDLAVETFYHARSDLIQARLDEIAIGCAPAILEAADDRHRSRGTCCVGVRWDAFEKQDLMEIVKCLPGQGLAAMCRLLCEDYAGRASGVPDLMVWKASDSDCRFVEVKGPNDKLQENQKIWIDFFLQSGVRVELCSVAEKGHALRNNKPRKRKVKDRGRSHKSKIPIAETDGEECIYVESEGERDGAEVTFEEIPSAKRQRPRRTGDQQGFIL